MAPPDCLINDVSKIKDREGDGEQKAKMHRTPLILCALVHFSWRTNVWVWGAKNERPCQLIVKINYRQPLSLMTAGRLSLSDTQCTADFAEDNKRQTDPLVFRRLRSLLYRLAFAP